MSRDWADRKEKLTSQILSILLARKTVRSGSFTLHLGKETDYYFDLRPIPSYPSDFSTLCNAYVELIGNEVGEVDRITGAAYSAVPFAIITSTMMKLPYLYMEKIEEQGSLTSPVYGQINKDDRVLILDDVIASGVTLLCIASVIRASGGLVEDAVVLVDREQGASELLAKERITLHKFLTASQVLSALKEKDLK